MKKVFLLGGYDLEMIEIKEILKQQKETFLDKKLSWGAKLSSYKEFLNDESEFIAIELEEDITPPKYYKKIDHHNDLPVYPTSLQQVADILHVKLTREQKLIAYNDAEHIKGMKKLCATKQEIEDIRKKDRAAQGVTKEDENLAKLSVEKAKDNFIYSYTPYFSTVADRIYDKYSKYVVYNDKKIVFYNYKLESILVFFEKNNIMQKDYYYGGGEEGFVGIKENIFSKEEIQQLINKFKKVSL